MAYGRLPETEGYGVSSTVFRSGRPFHSERPWSFVAEGLDSGRFGRALCSKGFFHLVSHPHVAGLWSQAGSVARFEPSGVRETGDGRGREPVFVGTDLRADEPRAALSVCLTADGEAPPLHDPFPAWDAYGIGDACDHDHRQRLPVA
ncbi:hypothetical protein F0L17_03015 [Streptomyces sp. TRM43335]|uniref:CobW C-terminal domain-containing protein n=1 Tax=Streptomyces taklimakanensis TaxID=2569853 RepID=A0A6G2B778_9ACTN|nr:hypothetical protein [Streptomyces taklimakanensis]